MFRALTQWFRPAPHTAPLPAEEVERAYPRLRWQVFEAAFMAYAMFYLVRNNFSPVQKEIGEALHYTKAMTGNIIAGTSLAYGIGKFVMGYFADRCDARKYVVAGMVLTAGINFLFGAAGNFTAHFWLWTLNGFIQGMGYGPCTRGLAHWYSARERGTVFGFWNISHNIGGGIAGVVAAESARFWGWQSAFYVPGGIALLGAVYLSWRMRDTPQSLGLPAVEDFKNDHPLSGSVERELSFREIFCTHILPNPMLWVLAVANVFVYIARYAMLDWGPTYLKEVKGATLSQGGWSTLLIEFAGAAGMLSMGWLSDKCGGRRARVSVLCMIPLLGAFIGIILVPAGMLWLDMVLFAVIGFFVYVPVMFSGVMSLDLTTKKAVGTAAGFVGFFGYLGRIIQGKWLGAYSESHGWEFVLWCVAGCTATGILLLALLWNVKPRA